MAYPGNGNSSNGKCHGYQATGDLLQCVLATQPLLNFSSTSTASSSTPCTRDARSALLPSDQDGHSNKSWWSSWSRAGSSQTRASGKSEVVAANLLFPRSWRG